MANAFEGLTFQDFSARLGHMTIPELRAEAENELGVKIPTTITRKLDVLKAVFEAGGGQVEPEGEPPHPLVAPPASSYKNEPEIEDKPPEGDDPRFKLLFRRSPGGYRCGKYWPKGYSDFNPDDWDEKEMAMFEADPRISIKRLR